MIPGVARLRQHQLPDPPEELGVRDGLSYALFRPADPVGGVVILHGAGSVKESHYDYARAARFMGITAVAFDARGHGESEGELDGRAIEDVATMAALIGDVPVALRGSSMGGYFAIAAASTTRAAAVVAICPAGSEHLLRGMDRGGYEFRYDEPGLRALLEANDLQRAVAELDRPLMLLHAEGDEVIPVAHSADLHEAARSPRKKFLALPGGHHRSIQHDAELQGETLRFIAKAFRGR
jgi:pimeloyl-ACP methyl ester carboxylesterase